MPKGFSTRRTQFIKSVRAQAHKEGTCFKNALENVKSTKAAKEVLLGYRTEEPPLSQRNIRGWYSDQIPLEDGDVNIYDEDVYDFKVDFSDDVHISTHKTVMTVSLFDLARPAKQKGVFDSFYYDTLPIFTSYEGPAKEFEVIKKAPKGAFLDNEEFEIWEDDLLWDDDWEQIYDEQRVDTRPSYSSILRGNER